MALTHDQRTDSATADGQAAVSIILGYQILLKEQ